MNKINWEQFKAIIEIKHKADVGLYDIIYLDDKSGFNVEEKTFDKVVCDSYCGDDFYGYVEDTGMRVGWRPRGDMYKIVGKQIRQHGEESKLDYPSAARAIALWLNEYCDENLPYPDMIAECARRASKEIDRLRAEIEELKRKA